MKSKCKITSEGRECSTGNVRGLLCSTCNTALGLLGDSEDRIKALLRYSRKYS